MEETDVSGKILIDGRGWATIKTGDRAYDLIYTGLSDLFHESYVIATGFFVGQSFLSHRLDVLA